jgi:hypothetical protein
MRTLTARALDQVADIKIKTVFVIICHRSSQYEGNIHLPAAPFLPNFMRIAWLDVFPL